MRRRLQGVVALPPTEVSYYDVEQDIADMELRLERFLAMNEVGPGQARAGVVGMGWKEGCQGDEKERSEAAVGAAHYAGGHVVCV